MSINPMSGQPFSLQKPPSNQTQPINILVVLLKKSESKTNIVCANGEKKI